MRILRQTETEGIIINAYECDNCDTKTIDSVLPPDWLEDSKNTHYCYKCMVKLGDGRENEIL